MAIADDVREYLRSIPDGMMFPNVRLDPRGRMAKNAGTAIDKWLRKTAGITDKRKMFHSFRHTFKSALRVAYPSGEDMRDYITGHASGKVATDYGRFPIAALIPVIESLSANPQNWRLDR